MKITKARGYISAIAVAAIVLSAGALYTLNIDGEKTPVVSAYTSAVNAQDPATARDDYVITFPDVNLKRALNPVIALAHNAARKQQGLPQDVVRTADQDITAGDMKYPVNMYGPLGLNGKGITNAEGLQFLVNATRLDIVGNQIADFAPLRDLLKLEELNAGANPATDVAPLAAIPNLAKLTLDRSPNLTDVTPLANAPKLKALHLPVTKVTNFAPLARIATLEELYINNMATRDKLNLTPLATAPKLRLINANANRLTGADFAVLKNMPALETLMTAGNNVLNMNDMLKEGFASLKRWSTFSDQLHAINVGADPIFKNPVYDVDGELIPVVETANVKNVDPDGTLNPLGSHVKLIDLYNRGKVDIRWEKNFTKGQVTDRPFSGTISVTYNLPPKDVTGPVFSPAKPSKIVSRKGVQIDLTDVMANDTESGLSPEGVTYNHTDIGLNPINPAKGVYVLTYTAYDNAKNRSTVTRDIEITDADELQAKAAMVNDALFEGRTADSAQLVREKKAAAEAIIAKNDATQQQIDEALSQLNNAIAGLQTDKKPLIDALAVFEKRPEYIKNHPTVAAAEAAVQALNGQANPAPADVKRDAEALVNAMYSVAKDILSEKITAAEKPAVIDGMEGEGVKELQRVLEEVKKVRDAAGDPTQQQAVEKAIADLQKAVDGLRVSTRPLQGAIGKYNAEPPHIQQDPGVVAALAAANQALNAPDKTPASVRKAAKDLVDALEAAKQAEADRQTQANDALARAEQYKTPDHIADAKAKAAAVKDPAKKAELEQKVKALEDAYAAKKNELQQLIARAADPATSDGASQATKDALAAALQQARTIDRQANAPQAEIEKAITDLKEKIAALRPDKAALQAVIASVPSESDFVKNDAEVRAKLQAANEVNGRDDATAEQIKQAKDELEKAIADARATEVEMKAEQARQAAAQTAIADAQKPGNQSPIYFTAAQGKIDAVKDQAKKADLQAQLDALKRAYDAKLNELRQLLEEAKKPELTDGMTEATKQALQQAIATATTPATDGDVDQAVYDALMSDVRAAIDGLRADTTPLEAAMTLHDDQPDYIKNNPAVAAAFRKAQGTRGMPRPGVKDVRDDAKALEDAINAARQAETTAQQTAADALQSATDKLNAPLAPDEVPVIDMPALEAQVAAVQDPARKAVLQAELDALKAKLAARQQQVDDYKKSEEGKRAEAERKAREEAERKAREEADRKAEAERRAQQKAQMDKGGLLSDTGMPVAAPAIGGLGAVLAGLWALLRRKRQ